MNVSNRLAIDLRGRLAPAASGVIALAFAVLAVSLSWPVTRESAWLAAPVQACGLVGVVIGVLVWFGRHDQRRLGQLAVLAGAGYYLQDLRAATSQLIFAAAFCLAYLWTAVCAHTMLAWPDGRLAGAGARVIAAACYLLAVGSQVARYVADRPAPPWGYGVQEPVTGWTRIGSLLFAAMAVTGQCCIGRSALMSECDGGGG